MLSTIVKRIGQMLLMCWAVGTLTFILTQQLSGDIAYRIAGSRYGYDHTDSLAAEMVSNELGLEQSGWQFYLHWLGDLIQFNLGRSLVSGQWVWQELAPQISHTLNLTLLALCLAFVLGTSLGLLSAYKPNGIFDRLLLLISSLVRALPTFIIAILLISLFAIELKWLPAGGYGRWYHYLLPAFSLALGLSAVSMRVSRQVILNVMQSNYYQFARLKGLSAWQTFFRHGLPNIAVPVITYHSVQLVYLIERVVIVESLFALPGSGHALVHAIIARDVPMIQGTALVMGCVFITFSLIADLINQWIDPRIQQGSIK